MTISGAMQSAVAGLRANARAVGSISENIANSQTAGYKRSFASMVTTTGGGGSGSGVRAVVRGEISNEGSMLTTSSLTDLAIAGEGFFVVSKNPNDPLQSNYFLTRAGSFKPDENGFLKNAAGYYLAAFPANDDGLFTGVDQTSFASLGSVNISQASQVAEATSEIFVSGNLPADETGTGVTTAPFISTVSYSNALGGSEKLSLSWQASDLTPNMWTVTVSGDDGTVYGTADVDFFDSGATPGAPSSFTGLADAGLPPPAAFAVAPDGTLTITINNAAAPQTLTMSLGAIGEYTGITQFAGDYSPQLFDVDGSEVTSLANAEIDEKGIVWGIYDNGDRKAMYQIPVAATVNPDGLRRVDGNAYALTRDSGQMTLNISGSNGKGVVTSFQLEASTTDIAQEMTDLIQTQRAYSSNGKVITTADEMLQETTNLKR